MGILLRQRFCLNDFAHPDPPKAGTSHGESCFNVLDRAHSTVAAIVSGKHGRLLRGAYPHSLRCRINPRASISLGLVRDHAVQVVKLVREQFENIIEHTRPLCVLGN